MKFRYKVKNLTAEEKTVTLDEGLDEYAKEILSKNELLKALYEQRGHIERPLSDVYSKKDSEDDPKEDSGENIGEGLDKDSDKVPKEGFNKDISRSFILSDKLRLKKGSKTINNNILVIGSAGSGKSRYIIKPNLLNLNGESIVVMDPYGDFLSETRSYLEENGYSIKVLNLNDLASSDKFNPIKYVSSFEDANIIASTIMEGVSNERDDFWKSIEKDSFLLLTLAVSFYNEELKVEKSMKGFVELLDDLVGVSLDPKSEEPDTSRVEKLVTNLKKSGKEDPIVKVWGKIMTSTKDSKGVFISTAASLSGLNTLCDTIFSDDNMDLDKFLENKTAIFINRPLYHNDFSFAINLLINTIIKVVCDTKTKREDKRETQKEAKKEEGFSIETKSGIPIFDLLKSEDKKIGELLVEAIKRKKTINVYDVDPDEKRIEVVVPLDIAEDKELIDYLFKEEYTISENCLVLCKYRYRKEKGFAESLKETFLGVSEIDRRLNRDADDLFEELDGIKLKAKGSRLHRVTFFLDEFTNPGSNSYLVKTLPVFKKSGISTIITMQTISQLKFLYPDLWFNIVSNYDTILLLGASQPFDAEFIVRAAGADGCSTDTMGLERKPKRDDAFTLDEVMRLPFDEEIVLVNGEPYIDKKNLK